MEESHWFYGGIGEGHCWHAGNATVPLCRSWCIAGCLSSVVIFVLVVISSFSVPCDVASVQVSCLGFRMDGGAISRRSPTNWSWSVCTVSYLLLLLDHGRCVAGIGDLLPSLPHLFHTSCQKHGTCDNCWHYGNLVLQVRRYGQSNLGCTETVHELTLCLLVWWYLCFSPELLPQALDLFALGLWLLHWFRHWGQSLPRSASKTAVWYLQEGQI